MSELGVRSAFKGYAGYPFHACVSINDEVLHGLASASRMVAGGDVVKVDLGVVSDGYCSDLAQTFVIDDGSLSAIEGRRLSNAVLSSLMAGINAAVVGNTVAAITMAIESSLSDAGFSPIYELIGHGVGRRLHEPPEVPNALGKDGLFRKDRKEVPLVPGMTLAIEPMAGLGKPEVLVRSDGWTIVMADGMPSAHWEHTILVTDGPAEILTEWRGI
jgi:methionyl aminopeptidase